MRPVIVSLSHKLFHQEKICNSLIYLLPYEFHQAICLCSLARFCGDLSLCHRHSN